jgi:hypothetical protein
VCALIFLQFFLSALGSDVKHAISESVVSTCRPLHNPVFALLDSGGFLWIRSIATDVRLLGRHDNVDGDLLTSEVVSEDQLESER